MRAFVLVKNGPAQTAFELQEQPRPQVKAGEVLIESEAFGLNFAEVMARLGHYRDAPPLPFVPGYEVVGRIVAVGAGVDPARVGQRVSAMTRFGGYAEVVATQSIAALEIGEELDAGIGVSLTVQGLTAVYMAEELIRLHSGEHVLIHAAAGGVGTLLVQLALSHGCKVYGTAGSSQKLAFLKEMGVQHPINYREQDFITEIQQIRGEAGLDVIFDPIGGKGLAKGMKLLAAGGRMIAFGGSSITQAKNFFHKIRIGLSFGFYHPVALLSPSRSLMGVNMLRLADQRPEVVARVFRLALELVHKGVLKPHIGAEYPAEQLPQAHADLESRRTMGKLVLKW
ncbi:MAG: zinc-binding dehydrogenase [Bacteroidota bacterium]